MLQHIQSSVAEAVYTFAGSSNGMCIVNADGPEQLNDFMMSAPAGPYCDVEIRPLADFAKQMDLVATALRHAK